MAKQGGDHDIESITLSARVDALIKLGLDKYGEGDLVGAMSDWEHALSLDPDAVRATEYLDYVRENYAQLEHQFDEAREVAAAAESAGVPFGEGGGLDLDDDGAYDAFEVDGDADAQLEEWIDSASVDEGWALDDLPPVAPLPPSPTSAEPGGEPAIGVAGGELGDGAAELAGEQALRDGLELELATSDAAVGAAADDEADFSGLNFLLEEPAAGPGAARHAAAPRRPAPAAALDLELPGDDEIEETVPGGDEPPPLPERPSISGEALAAFAVEPEPAAPDVGVPGTDVPADFDLGEVRRLDGALRDDRIVEPDDVADVRVTFHDLHTSEATMPARPSQTQFELPEELELEARAALPRVGRTETEDGLEETVERDAAKALWSLSFDADDDDEGNAGEEEDELTRERRSAALGLDELGINVDLAVRDQRAPTMDPALEAGVILDDGLQRDALDLEATRELRALPDDGLDLDADEFTAARGHTATGKNKRALVTGNSERGPAIDAARMELVSAQIDREIDAGMPAEESADDRTRRRVSALIDRAAREHGEGHFPTAVAALDLALDERPESAIAQKIVHRHRDLLFEIYGAYIGDEARVPVVALPMHEIALQELDSRAAFLLSRIDGMLTFEEILDVAGMSRMEAFRHLSRLLLRGILEVR